MKRFQPSTKAAQIRHNRVVRSARRNGWTVPPVLVYYEDLYIDDLSESQYKDLERAKEKGDLKLFINTLNKVHDGDGIMETLYERHKEFMTSTQNAEYKNNYNEPGTQIRVLNTVLKPLEDAFKAKWSSSRIEELKAKMTPGELKNFDFAMQTWKYKIASDYLTAVEEKIKNEEIQQNIMKNLIPVNLVSMSQDQAQSAKKEADKAKKQADRAKKKIKQLEEQLAAQVEVEVVDTSTEDANTDTTATDGSDTAVDTALVEETALETEEGPNYTKILFVAAGVTVVAAAVGYWWYTSRATNA